MFGKTQNQLVSNPETITNSQMIWVRVQPY